MNLNRNPLIFLIFALLLIIPLISQSDAFLQTGGKWVAELQPGESYTFEWGLNSEKDIPVVLILRAEGDGAELLSFPEKIDAPPNQWVALVVTVTVPEDHPTDLRFNPTVIALLAGEKGGVTVFNLQMKKDIEIIIGNPPIPEVVAEESIEQTIDEEVMEESEEEQEPGTFTLQGAQEEQESETSEVQQTEEEGGGCLISTATFGSELAPQVQMLREIRDNSLLTTTSGSAFMSGFNTIYYSFSPTIADLERQSPIFQEAVKLTLTPLITSLSILNYVDMDSEAEVLGYGISLILLNIGMYFVAPAILITKLRR